eukprot:364430-Chlamydomonas_euryale.AAC.7
MHLHERIRHWASARAWVHACTRARPCDVLLHVLGFRYDAWAWAVAWGQACEQAWAWAVAWGQACEHAWAWAEALRQTCEQSWAWAEALRKACEKAWAYMFCAYTAM